MKRCLPLLSLLFVCLPALAQIIPLDPPGQEEFILDRAGVITAPDAGRIKEVCTKLLHEQAVPIVVVTIESMAACNAPDMRIETFATLLFNQWGIGQEKVQDQSFNRGMLLLVSEGDRKARIELGADWGREYDPQAAQIMQENMIPFFKDGNFSGGILAGVEALDKLARGLEIPRAPASPYSWLIILGVAALAVFTAVSLARRGASGWAWLLWAGVFGVLGYVLYQAATQSSRGGSGLGGGFSGGSFGGGFSGGGGASGSW